MTRVPVRFLWLIVPAILLLSACAGQRPPAAFLRPEYKPWNDWLNKVVDVNFANVPIGSLTTRAPFEQMNIVLSGIDPDYRIALEAQNVSRRQALWMLANQYGLSINIVATAQGPAPTVAITNRVLRRENRPLD